HHRVRQADDVHRSQARQDVDLNLHQLALEAHDRCGEDFSKHVRVHSKHECSNVKQLSREISDFSIDWSTCKGRSAHGATTTSLPGSAARCPRSCRRARWACWAACSCWRCSPSSAD